MGDPGLEAAVRARDLPAVVGHLADRFAMPDDHDEWVLDMLMDGLPGEVDDETRVEMREFIRENLDAAMDECREVQWRALSQGGDQTEGQ